MVGRSINPAIEAIKREILPTERRVDQDMHEMQYGKNIGYNEAIADMSTRLDACLAKAVVVYGHKGNNREPIIWSYGSTREKSDTHTALLIGIQPIEQAVSTQELKDALWVAEHKLGMGIFGELATRLDDHGVKESP